MDFYWILQPNSAPVRRNCCRSCSLLFIAWSSEDHNARKRYSVYIFFLYIANQWKKMCCSSTDLWSMKTYTFTGISLTQDFYFFPVRRDQRKYLLAAHKEIHKEGEDILSMHAKPVKPESGKEGSSWTLLLWLPLHINFKINIKPQCLK